MNYISEINAFNDWCEQHYLPMEAQFLWYKLMAKNNRLDWCEWMSVDNLELMGILKVKREATVIEVRDRLLEAGLVQYIKGKKGIPNRYKMISLSKLKVQTVAETVVKGNALSELKVEPVVNTVVQSVVESVVETVDITKQNKTKPNETKDSTVLEGNSKGLTEDRKKSSRAKSKKQSFGEFQNVKLTEAEYKKLYERFDKTIVEDKIDWLDFKIQNKAKKYVEYTDHYAVILSWCKKDTQNGGGVNGQDGKSDGGGTGTINNKNRPPENENIFMKMLKEEQAKEMGETS